MDGVSAINPALLQEALKKADAEEKSKILAILEELEKRQLRDRAQNDFLAFVEAQWPDFVCGAHHRRIAKVFEDVAAGKKKRVIINLAPRHTKSEFASFLLPAWILGKFPKKKVLQVSNTAELAEGFGRKVRNLLPMESYRDIFPGVELRSDSKAAGRWNTNHGGDYYATGVGAALAGRGADIAIIDDPHTEAEALQSLSNPGIYDKVYDWYTSGIRQRLQPGGAIIIVQCMTGDTLVLMADGTEKPLREVRPGESVATFDHGRLAISTVKNWRSNGVDSIYKIQTQSGRILRANERHPFLIMNEGVLEWTRLRNLRRGDLLVSLKDATDHHGQKQNPENVAHAKRKTVITAKTQMPHITHLGIMANTKVKSVLSQTVKNLCTAMAYAITTMQKAIGLQEEEEVHPNNATNIGSNADTVSLLSNTKRYLPNRMGFARCAENPPETMLGRTGAVSSVSTIAMTQEKLEGCSAMTVISQSGMARHQKYLNELRRISDFTADLIVSITPDGEEEVFDVEIDRTENFIANGVVSHNTRWSLRDLTGQVLENAHRTGASDEWEVFEFPAILPSGKPLWPEYWSLEELEAVKADISARGLGKWNAQYQQQPTSDENAIIKRDWWQTWEKKDPPPVDYIIMAMDTAHEAKNSADYSVAVFFGVWNNPDDDDQPNLILLNAWRDKLEFPELKAKAFELYKKWEPDSVIIEKKASGAPLITELRRAGIPVQEYTPSRGTAASPNNKIARLHAISDIFASKRVWAPRKPWADDLIDEIASFPSGRYDDYVDATSLCLTRFRVGGFIGTRADIVDSDENWKFKAKKAAYY